MSENSTSDQVAPKPLAPPKRRSGGFALLVTLSLMVLLVVIAVGLLSLGGSEGDRRQAE